MDLACKLHIFCCCIAGKLASVDGPRRDKCGRLTYGVVIKDKAVRWVRDYDRARELAEAHNAKVRAKADEQVRLAEFMSTGRSA